MPAAAAIAPTPERIRQSRRSYQPPAKDQKSQREYGRFAPWFETMGRKTNIDGPSLLAASDLDLYWRSVHDARGITCSYGDQRWSTPVAHMSTAELLRPERRELHRQRLNAARDAVGTIGWDALEAMIKRDDGDLTEAGIYLGYAPAYAQKVAPRIVKDALYRLACLWGYQRPMHEPQR